MGGGEAHRIIQQAIDPTYSDWRMETGTVMEDFATSEVGIDAE